MIISVQWLNKYLSPADCSADEVERVLTHAGFPIEERVDLDGGDVQMDVEVTSNRGDALCHVGLAREIAAATGRELVVPQGTPASGSAVEKETGVSVLVDPKLCPRFTARVIKGVKVGPSPEWLRAALEAVGLRPINNVVDVTNYVLMELGQPSHVFDLGELAEHRLVVRHAEKGETLTTLDENELELDHADVVVADAERARSLAGVIGGLDSGVTSATTDVLLEAATWDEATVRTVSRRYNIRTDASHRFERTVDPAQIDACADRIASLIVEVAGGELVGGAIAEGPALVEPEAVSLRASRCNAILGIELSADRMSELLRGLGFKVETNDGVLACVVPPHRRHDVKREIDLIEEVARAEGFASIPVHETMPARTASPQASEAALKSLGEALTGMGFYETVTFSFATRADAELFMPPGMRALAVDENRRKETPALRPSAVPTLLECRMVNQNGGVEPGGVRLFETSSVFAEWDGGTKDGETAEHRNVTLLMDAPDAQEGVRAMRGVIDSLVHRLGGEAATVGVKAMSPYSKAYRADAFAGVTLGGEVLGCFGVIDKKACKKWPIEVGLVAAELNLDALIGLYPPASKAEALPAFPAIERDLSVVVKEATAWAEIEKLTHGARPAMLEGLRFVGVYRGKPLEKGQKSVTFRMKFRDPSRTLRHEEVDPQVESVVSALKKDLGAELRA